jgi:WD40 repeat protein
MSSTDDFTIQERIFSETKLTSADTVSDEINDTGCRLVAYKPKKKDTNGWKGSFSASWDPNNSDVLYVCSQNGILKEINVKLGTEKYYQVIFRRFTGAVGREEVTGRPVRNHWDKMTMIPGSPGEFLFLMGISNTVCFTAIPGSKSPLSELTDGEAESFSYGTCILRIYSHRSRVTSMSVSPFGQVYASGDENGFLNFINFRAVPKDDEEALWWSCPTASPEHKNPLLRAHAGPIFSLQWLPLLHYDDRDAAVFYLATGSEDRMVSLWPA